MKITEVARLLSASFYCGEEYQEKEVKSGCGADMMSDVLAFAKDHSVLLTGLLNPQVVRTAEMMDIICIVLVRGKQPTDTMIELACERSLPLLVTQHTMFDACGILYRAGIPGRD